MPLEERTVNPTQEVEYFEDYYEILEVQFGVDSEVIGRAYKSLVQRYHPDNQETGDVEKFMQVVKAHEILSSPETRAIYDSDYRQSSSKSISVFVPTPESEEDGYARDRKMFDMVLTLLYNSRRTDPRHGGMGTVQLEQKLGCTASHLEFHLWYLREKGWVERQETGLMAITAKGVDRTMEQSTAENRERRDRKWFRRYR
jgi:hypothetical protein